MKKRLLVIGLGNPGREYSKTRHNIGFMVVEELVSRLGLSLKKEKSFQADSARGLAGDATWHCLFPMTYMNLSGQAVRGYIDYHGIKLEEILVVVDDADLPFGKLRLKASGSAGGHNGLKSLEQHLGTREYARLKVGIGSPAQQGFSQMALEDYVLAPFSREQAQGLPSLIGQAVEAILQLQADEIDKVMNLVNGDEKKKLTRKPPEEGQE